MVSPGVHRDFPASPCRRRRHAGPLRCRAGRRSGLPGGIGLHSHAGDRAVYLRRLQFLPARGPLALHVEGQRRRRQGRGPGLSCRLLDYIGWVDRFASPAHTARQRQIARSNGLSNIYTPQVVRNGLDWRDFTRAASGSDPARARIAMQRGPTDAFEASVAPVDPGARWSAYWTVTEHGHSSKVKSGENAGELLKHDFVVRQYVPAGDYQGSARLVLRAVPGEAGHARQVNLVVFDKPSGKPLQALSLGC